MMQRGVLLAMIFYLSEDGVAHGLQELVARTLTALCDTTVPTELLDMP